MTGTDLANEISYLLEENYTLNPVWSAADLHTFIAQNFELICESTGGADRYDTRTLESPSGCTCTLLSSDTMTGIWFVRSISASYPIVDIMDVDLLTGVTNPYGPGTPQVCTLEMEGGLEDLVTGVSIATPVVRFFPRFTNTGTTITIWFRNAPTTSQGAATTIEMRSIFILPLKFKCLSDALYSDTELRDPQRAEVWKVLSDIMVQALKSLYRGGQL